MMDRHTKDFYVTMRYSPSLAAFCTLLTLLAGCSQPARQEITDVREQSSFPQGAPPKLSTAQRLDLAPGGAMASGASANPLDDINFHFEMPAGWESAPKTDLRQVNLRMTDVPEVECYFTLLPGGAGGVEANLNRWRGQMGQDPLTPEAIAALPEKPLFGQPGTFILIDGAYQGMGTTPKDDYRMYGLILSHTDPESGKEQAFFLKMTGPRDVLEGQEAAFDQIAETLHAVMPGEQHDHGEAQSATAGAEAPTAEHPVEATAAGFTWAVPEGWEELAPSMMRQANLTITGQPDVECYFTVLAGNGGGLEMNINRWQRQMGQKDLPAEQIAALPQHTLLGGDANLVTIDGTFGGMGGAVEKANFRMYGLVHVDDTQAYFVKMTGPRDVVAAQEANFLAFSASIKRGGAPAAATAAAPTTGELPSGHPAMPADAAHANAAPGAAAVPAGSFDPEALQWTAPEGWQDGGERMMRLVTYEIGEVECYVTSLSGDAGGVDANINRWVGQLGQEPLDKAALAALPRITILGQEGPLVEVSGKFKGMSGEEKDAYKLLGTIVPAGDQTVFVKMTGPGAAVDAQKKNFIAFCESLR